MGAPVVAQTAAPEPPSLLQGLDLDRLRFETRRDGQREIERVLSDGTQIEAKFETVAT